MPTSARLNAAGLIRWRVKPAIQCPNTTNPASYRGGNWAERRGRDPVTASSSGGSGRCGGPFSPRAASARPCASCSPAIGARDDMIEGQIIADAAILALKPVAQEHVKPRERRMLGRFDILLQRNHRWQLHSVIGRMDLALIMIDNVDAVEKNRLYGRLPRPDTERIIAERRIISIEHKRRASVRMADKVGVVHALPKSLSCLRAPSGLIVTVV
jgi:hypothetical protein